MLRVHPVGIGLILLALSVSVRAGDWTGFRGPGGQGVSDETGLPLKWSATENIAWKTALPGPGASTPITVGGRVYLTCYTGYGLEPNAGDQNDLKRHLVCVDRARGGILWTKTFEPRLPEHKYEGEGSYHGYAASTPVTDGERLYISFGKSGVYCLDLEGKEQWHEFVGDDIDRWGSGCSPVLFGKLLLVNASIESKSLVALDKSNGAEVWRAGGVNRAWNSPVIVNGKDRPEVIVSIQDRLLSFDPRDGKPLWNADGVHRYVCPTVVSHDDVVYAIGGGHTSLAVRAGGSGDVTASHTLWRVNKGSNVSSPIYYDGHLYWAHEKEGFLCCQNAMTGETVFQERFDPRPGLIWSSPILADGRLYFLSQTQGTFVVACKPKYELLAVNTFADDESRSNASPVPHNGQLLLRNDRNLYCIGKK